MALQPAVIDARISGLIGQGCSAMHSRDKPGELQKCINKRIGLVSEHMAEPPSLGELMSRNFVVLHEGAGIRYPRNSAGRATRAPLPSTAKDR